MAKSWRLRVDGVDRHFRTYEQAHAAVPEAYQRWSIDKRVGGRRGRYFNYGCGLSYPGLTALADLAEMGVPINRRLLAR